MPTTYVALIHKSTKKKADYGVMFPDFPGAVFGGRTIDDAVKNSKEGIVFHIDGMLKEGIPIPEATSLDDIVSNPEYASGIPCLISIILPTGKCKRLNISIDSGLLAEIDQAAKRCGKNRSEFLADAARLIVE